MPVGSMVQDAPSGFFTTRPWVFEQEISLWRSVQNDRP